MPDVPVFLTNISGSAMMIPEFCKKGVNFMQIQTMFRCFDPRVKFAPYVFAR